MSYDPYPLGHHWSRPNPEDRFQALHRRVLLALQRLRARTLRAARLVFLWAMSLNGVAVGYFLILNVVNPPATMFMLLSGSNYTYQPVELRSISCDVVAAVIAHEDVHLGTRSTGLDWQQYFARVRAYLDHNDDPFGSSIPQQLAKNLVLPPDQNVPRKILDAVLGEELAHTMPRTRLLEIYLSTAQFGPGVYGVGPASKYYFDSRPDQLTTDQAAQLAAVLSRPEQASRAASGGVTFGSAVEDAKMLRVKKAVRQQIKRNGGRTALLKTVQISENATSRLGDQSSCLTKMKR